MAGLGTRFLPATKAVPKEMLTVVDRPRIQHVVDEARAAGIEHFIFVTGRNKGAIEDHFDSQFELERTLAERGKKSELEQLMAELPRAGPDQLHAPAEPRSGLGHAVWCAREIVGDEPFALLLPDMLHHGGQALPGRDDRGLRGARRQPHRRLAGARGPDAPLRHRRRRGQEGQGFAHHRHDREAASPRHGALQSAHHRALHPAAGDIRHPRARRARRRRRDPDHRCHDQARRRASRSSPCASTARSTTAGARSAS